MCCQKSPHWAPQVFFSIGPTHSRFLQLEMRQSLPRTRLSSLYQTPTCLALPGDKLWMLRELANAEKLRATSRLQPCNNDSATPNSNDLPTSSQDAQSANLPRPASWASSCNLLPEWLLRTRNLILCLMCCAWCGASQFGIVARLG